MTTKVDYTPLSGGLDLVSGALNVRPGRLSECVNFEQVFGKQGYRRIDGYERFDGQAEPHRAIYHVMGFDSGAVELVPGDVVTGAGGAGAEVLAVEVEGGAWDGTAAGRLIVIAISGVFALGESLSVAAQARAKVAALPVMGSISQRLHKPYLAMAREVLRQAIAVVPGAGPVLGVAVYQGDVYAARDAADGKTAAIYKSSPTGWQSVRTGLLPGGRFRFDVANFSGASTSIALFGVDGKNGVFRWDGGMFTQAKAIFGTQASSASSVTLGTGTRVFTILESARSWTTGQELIAYSSANAGNRMTGTVVSYAGNVLTLAVTAFEGSGDAADWEIGRADFKDKPYLVTEHKDHLFLAYPLGQLQTSNLGDPMTYTTTAALFGLGDEITGLASMKGSVMGAFCLGRVHTLTGSSSADWVLQPYSNSAGAKHDTVQEMGGNALFLDDRGLTSLQATQNFGDFEPSIFSRDAKPMLDVLTPKVIGARIAKSKFQYRLYANDGTRLTATILSPEAIVRPQDVAFTRQMYAHIPTCIAQGDMDDGSEGLFFGTVDGFVMREDVGSSFDGGEVAAVLRLHFNHLKSPANKKRYRKLELELESPDTVEILFRQQFDYSDGYYQASLTQKVLALGGGGQWDVSNWDQFRWSMPIANKAEANIDGVGRNMGLLIWHESSQDPPFLLQGLLLQFTILGISK